MVEVLALILPAETVTKNVVVISMFLISLITVTLSHTITYIVIITIYFGYGFDII